MIKVQYSKTMDVERTHVIFSVNFYCHSNSLSEVIKCLSSHSNVFYSNVESDFRNAEMYKRPLSTRRAYKWQESESTSNDGKNVEKKRVFDGYEGNVIVDVALPIDESIDYAKIYERAKLSMNDGMIRSITYRFIVSDDVMESSCRSLREMLMEGCREYARELTGWDDLKMVNSWYHCDSSHISSQPTERMMAKADRLGSDVSNMNNLFTDEEAKVINGMISAGCIEPVRIGDSITAEWDRVE